MVWGLSLAKSKIQNVGLGAALPALPVSANTVDSVSEFIYLSSEISSDGHSTLEMMRRIALATLVMNQLGQVWRQRNLRLATKLRLYETCVLSVLLYCSESWTLLQADVDRLQAFHMRSRRRLACYVTNAEIKVHTRLEEMKRRIRRRKRALFGHVAGMQVPAHDALRTALEVCCGSIPDARWKRPRGLPRTTWSEQLRMDLDDVGFWEAWYLVTKRGRWREFATSLCCSRAR